MEHADRCQTYSCAVSPGINSSKHDWDKTLTDPPAYQRFQKLSFCKQVSSLRSASDTNICHIGKFFFPMIHFEKIVVYNFKNKLDFLHFKCSLNVSNFDIGSPLTNY